jgi:Zn-dependent protease with chaperone function
VDERALFNLIFNSACSFVAGCLAVYCAVKLFKIGASRWKLYLFTLPFLKIFWDLAVGIPSDSYLHTAINPFHVPSRHHTITVGAGFGWGPSWSFSTEVIDEQGKKFSISLADYFHEFLFQKVSPHAPLIVLAIFVVISSCLIARRIFLAVRFERERRKDRQSATSEVFQKTLLGSREVDVYLSEHYRGTPFTGGISHPYICIPKETAKLLSAQELDAVLRHELAHIKYYDLFVNFFVLFVGDLFWFVPFYRPMTRRIDRLREILADQSAVLLGASAELLASALLKLKESGLPNSSPALYSAFAREASLLRFRVRKLLSGDSEIAGRFGWSNHWLRWIYLVLITEAVMLGSFGGNHKIAEIPDWIMKYLQAKGWV